MQNKQTNKNERKKRKLRRKKKTTKIQLAPYFLPYMPE